MRARGRTGYGWKRWSKKWLYDQLGLFNDYRLRRWSGLKVARATQMSSDRLLDFLTDIKSDDLEDFPIRSTLHLCRLYLMLCRRSAPIFFGVSAAVAEHWARSLPDDVVLVRA